MDGKITTGQPAMILRQCIPIFVALLSSYGLAESAKLSPSTYFSKLSSRIRDYRANDQDFDEMASALNQKACLISKMAEKKCLKTFLEKKIKDFLDSQDFAEAMVTRWDDLLNLRPNYLRKAITDLRQIYEMYSEDEYTRNNALDDLLLRVFKTNLSWDEIFTSNFYRVYGLSGNSTTSDLEFFRAVADHRLPYYLEKGQSIPIKIDPNIAGGVFSTTRFLNSLPNTLQNENRSRAAAVFRTAFCDAMVPSIERGPEAEALENQMALGNAITQAVTALPDPVEKNHAKSDCMKCHYKIEPMA